MSQSSHDNERPAFITRFAPSPTGYLHLGHAFSALTAFDAADAVGGRCLLRFEDIDHTRCRPEFEAAIGEDLAWLGLAWDLPVRRQSEHREEYARALARLIAADLVYRCFKTRKDVLAAIARAPHGPAAETYVGAPLARDEEEDRVARGDPFAWRLSLARARDHLGGRWEALGFVEEGRGPAGETGWIPAQPQRRGDVVLARKDAGTSYHMAAVWDDALQGVTHVIRGEDLFDATHLHVLLQALLALPTPIYRHHRLILGGDGKRLAKRDQAATLQALRAAGATPQDLRRRVGLG